MAVSRDMLLSELKELQRLTAFEQAVATVRRTQAATAPIAAELAANASKASERLDLLAQTVRRAGGTPDLVGPVLGKLGALVQTQVNQVQTLQGALLGDLALEHQLRERARYARSLAVTLGEASVVPAMDRLDAAHTETIAWLERRLDEVARTGSSALQATPVQAAVGAVRAAVATPFALTAEGINRLGALAGRVTRRTPAVVSDAVDTVTEKVTETAGDVARTAADTASSAADAVSSAAETVSEGAQDVADTSTDAVADAAQTVSDAAENAAETTAETVADAAETAADETSRVLDLTGGDDVADEKAPFAGYERLTGDSIMRHVDDTEDVEELRTLLAFEQAHKARKGVLKAAQERLDTLASRV